jgi:NitT/TauT family transport system permease protein
MANLPFYTAATLTRLAIAYVISLGIALTMGILAAERKGFAIVFYPIYDVGQSVPILALFPILFISLSQAFGGRLGLEITSITMLVADMIWYLFLNIVAAVKTIPDEIREVSQLLGMKGLQRVRHIILPAILPAVVTGSILSWATGWNTVIFSEYMPYGSKVLWLPGLGSFLDKAALQEGNTILLGFLLLIMTTIVLAVDRLVWRRLLRKVERYAAESM